MFIFEYYIFYIDIEFLHLLNFIIYIYINLERFLNILKSFYINLMINF